MLPMLPGLAFAASVSRSCPSSGISWSKCPVSYPSSVDCGFFDAPIDYSNPGAGTIRLGLARLKTNGTARLGNLVFNPGGPGGAASIDVAKQVTQAIPLGVVGIASQVVRERYNIVGFDPRGTGLSTPIECDPAIYNERIDQFDYSEAAYEKLVDHNKRFGDSCARKSGKLINFMDTGTIAKDYELLRLVTTPPICFLRVLESYSNTWAGQALGDAKLNFLGVSYGSMIGSQYAELYPDTVGRMVLDACDDHSGSQVQVVMGEVSTYENVLNSFFKWCADTPECALHGLGHELPSQFDAFIDAANARAIPAPECVKSGGCRGNVTGLELLANMQGQLVPQNRSVPQSTTSWADVSIAIAQAMNGSAPAQLSDVVLPANTTTFIEFTDYAVLCQDWAHDIPTAAALKALVLTVQALAPHTRGVSQSFRAQAGCIGWPTALTNPPRLFDVANIGKAPPVLLLQSYVDGEASIAWAVGLRRQMPTARIVFRAGSGHGSYGLGGETSKVADKFFVEGSLPEDGTVYES